MFGINFLLPVPNDVIVIKILSSFSKDWLLMKDLGLPISRVDYFHVVLMVYFEHDYYENEKLMVD